MTKTMVYVGGRTKQVCLQTMLVLCWIVTLTSGVEMFQIGTSTEKALASGKITKPSEDVLASQLNDAQDAFAKITTKSNVLTPDVSVSLTGTDNNNSNMARKEPVNVIIHQSSQQAKDDRKGTDNEEQIKVSGSFTSPASHAWYDRLSMLWLTSAANILGHKQSANEMMLMPHRQEHVTKNIEKRSLIMDNVSDVDDDQNKRQEQSRQADKDFGKTLSAVESMPMERLSFFPSPSSSSSLPSLWPLTHTNDNALPVVLKADSQNEEDGREKNISDNMNIDNTHQSGGIINAQSIFSNATELEHADSGHFKRGYDVVDDGIDDADEVTYVMDAIDATRGGKRVHQSSKPMSPPLSPLALLVANTFQRRESMPNVIDLDIEPQQTEAQTNANKRQEIAQLVSNVEDITQAKQRREKEVSNFEVDNAQREANIEAKKGKFYLLAKRKVRSDQVSELVKELIQAERAALAARFAYNPNIAYHSNNNIIKPQGWWQLPKSSIVGRYTNNKRSQFLNKYHSRGGTQADKILVGLNKKNMPSGGGNIYSKYVPSSNLFTSGGGNNDRYQSNTRKQWQKYPMSYSNAISHNAAAIAAAKYNRKWNSKPIPTYEVKIQPNEVKTTTTTTTTTTTISPIEDQVRIVETMSAANVKPKTSTSSGSKFYNLLTGSDAGGISQSRWHPFSSINTNGQRARIYGQPEFGKSRRYREAGGSISDVPQIGK